MFAPSAAVWRNVKDGAVPSARAEETSVVVVLVSRKQQVEPKERRIEVEPFRARARPREQVAIVFLSFLEGKGTAVPRTNSLTTNGVCLSRQPCESRMSCRV